MERNQPLLLIVDDDRASRLLLGRLLKKDELELHFAEDGEQALKQARELEPDLILLDVVMPKKDGFEVCRELRQNPTLAEVPVVMITALEDHESRMKGLEAGADDFISKPFKPVELRARVKTICRLDRYRRIRNERARFAWVMEQADEGYIVVDSEGQVLFSNEAAQTLLSLPASTQGLDLRQRLESEFNPLDAESWALFPEFGDHPITLVRPGSANSPASWLSLKSVSHQISTETEHLLQLQDVTAEQTSQRSVWSFESLVAHKLRTPLTKMTWGLSFIKKKAHRLSIEKIVEFAEMSQEGVDELKEGLDDVTSYLNAPTAIPAGDGVSPARLETLFNELAGQLELHPPILEVNCQHWLYISHRAFGLILWELCRNARKFHPEQKPQLHVSLKENDGKGYISVADDGVELAPEQLRQAFEPYYQGEKDFTGNVPGMGLGLAMVRGMVAEVGGSWTIRNRDPGPGVLVELGIPLVL